jgi:hypothetical protein
MCRSFRYLTLQNLTDMDHDRDIGLHSGICKCITIWQSAMATGRGPM